MPVSIVRIWNTSFEVIRLWYSSTDSGSWSRKSRVFEKNSSRGSGRSQTTPPSRK